MHDWLCIFCDKPITAEQEDDALTAHKPGCDRCDREGCDCFFDCCDCDTMAHSECVEAAS